MRIWHRSGMESRMPRDPPLNQLLLLCTTYPYDRNIQSEFGIERRKEVVCVYQSLNLPTGVEGEDNSRLATITVMPWARKLESGKCVWSADFQIKFSVAYLKRIMLHETSRFQVGARAVLPGTRMGEYGSYESNLLDFSFTKLDWNKMVGRM